MVLVIDIPIFCSEVLLKKHSNKGVFLKAKKITNNFDIPKYVGSKKPFIKDSFYQTH